MPRSKRTPLVLAILDGWGMSPRTHGNAIAAAHLPHWHAFLASYPHTLLDASGEAVGLPPGIMGNSEVGHLNLGSGRVVQQGVVIIDEEIAAGNFSKNVTLKASLDHVRADGGTLHLLGLLSDGQVHSSLEHLFALIDAAVVAKLPFAIHAFLDGRDTPPRSAQTYVERLEEHLAAIGSPGAIASISGRFYGMDRDKRWERTELAYNALARGVAPQHAPSARAAVEHAYANGESDEFAEPTLIAAVRPVRDGDACIFFNFRPDRARQLTLAFSDPGFDAFSVVRYHRLLFATMTKYDETYSNPVLFGARPQYETFGDVIAHAGLRQLRLAETEKYAHVTYFFNGGREEMLPGETRKLIPSDRSVKTYDLAPAMRAREITDEAVAALASGAVDVIVMNYANADMVGHTGKWEQSIASLEVLDENLARLADAVLAANGLLAITADHGNVEEKIDAEGNPLTAHTTNPVPLVLIGKEVPHALIAGGKLGDVAPTLLALLQLPIPAEMTGTKLLG